MGRKKTLGILVLLWAMFSGVALPAGLASAAAGSKYNGNEARCLAESGGREGIHSVQYACNKAATGNQNGCSLWIGSASAHGIPEIYADSPTGTVAAAFWGMCTDRINTTKGITVYNDNDSIADNMLLTRGLWNAPTAVGTTIDVAKFVAGATPSGGDECYKKYTMTVMVGRWHSDGASYDEMPEDVTLWVPTSEKCNKPEPDPCPGWAPEGYVSADKFHGTTTIDVRVRDLAPRFGRSAQGAWNKADTEGDAIYVMPTDEVRWTLCYYAGTPGTADTDISTLNGDKVGEFDDFSEAETCDPKTPMPEKFIEERATNTWNMGYKKLMNSVVAKYGQDHWQNRWWAEGDGQIIQAEDIPGNFNSPEYDKKKNIAVSKFTGYKTTVGDVGSTKNETGTTDIPTEVKIKVSEVTKELREQPCCDPATGKMPDPSTGVPVPCLPDPMNCGCNFEYDNTLNEATVSFNKVLGTPGNINPAYVKVPYNYTNYVFVSLAEKDNYSGENTITVQNLSVLTMPRNNALTKATYATIVPSSSTKLFGFVVSESGLSQLSGGVKGSDNVCGMYDTKQCAEFGSWGGTLNGGGSLGGDEKVYLTNADYNSFDASAGDYVCFIATVWPADSANDRNMSGGGSGYFHSGADCRIIGKRPTFQVWGDTLYSVANVENTPGDKHNIYRSGNYIKSGGGSTYFGSWAEEALIIKNGISGNVASGAATGINNSISAGAGNSGDFLSKRSPLSFSNNTDITGSGKVGKSNIPPFGKERQEELIDYWATGKKTGNCSGLGLSGEKRESGTGKVVCYVESNGINISGGDIAGGGNLSGATYLIKSNGNININGNIRYTGTYTMLRHIPKVVIFAKGNINISCGVSEVDAILLSAGRVNTCSNHSGPDGTSDYDGVPTYNATDRQTPLKIFGTVMTNTIELGRTYGAAANSGNMYDARGSGLPSDGAAAEVFDYDSTILMWSEFMSGAQESDTLQTTYQHELAPRY